MKFKMMKNNKEDKKSVEERSEERDLSLMQVR